MLRSTFAVMAAFCLGTGLASLSQQRPETRDRREAPPIKLTVDRDVLETVLLDLVTHKEKGRLLDSNVVSEKEVVFDPKPLGWKRSDTPALDEEPAGKKLKAAERARIEEAREDIIARSHADNAHISFSSKDRRIKVLLADVKRDQDWASVESVRAYPPGYSKDRSTAVVLFHFPYSIHAGEGLYVLQWKRGKWVVVVRKTLYRA